MVVDFGFSVLIEERIVTVVGEGVLESFGEKIEFFLWRGSFCFDAVGVLRNESWEGGFWFM